MVKLLEVIGRRADFTHEAFLEHVSTTHLEVVDRVPEFRNRVRRYMQNHLYLDPLSLGQIHGLPICLTKCDVVIEVWFDSVDAIMQCFQEPRYFEIIRPDELSFGDVPGAWGLTTDEVPVMERAGFGGHTKLFAFLMRTPGLSHDQFVANWQLSRERLVASATARRHLGRWIDNGVRQPAAERLPGMKDYNLVAELWFESLASLSAFCSDPETLAVFRNGDLIDASQTLFYVGQEQPATAEWLRRGQAVA